MGYCNLSLSRINLLLLINCKSLIAGLGSHHFPLFLAILWWFSYWKIITSTILSLTTIIPSGYLCINQILQVQTYTRELLLAKWSTLSIQPLWIELVALTLTPKLSYLLDIGNEIVAEREGDPGVTVYLLSVEETAQII